MIIDLHIHTQKVKKGDSKERIISTKDFIDKMHRNRVKIAAITNHNKFDINEFNKINNEEIDFQLYPGIELDVEFKKGMRHIILIADPEIANKFYAIFDNETNRDYDKHYVSYHEFIEKVQEFYHNEIIIIPHFLDKDKERAILDEERIQLMNDLDNYSIILETGSLASMGIINSHNVLSLIGSDVSNWNHYDSSKLPQLKFNISSFRSFYELSKDPKAFISKALVNTSRLLIPLTEEWSPTNTDITVPIYNDINIFFGEKGSGKSILLEKNVLPYLTKQGYSVKYHSGVDYENIYDTLVRNFEDRIKINESSIVQLQSLCENILNYTEDQINNQYSDYFKKHKNNNSSKNANRIKKTESFFSNKSNNNDELILQKNSNDLSKVNQIISLVEEYKTFNNFSSGNLLEELINFKKVISNKNITDIKHNFINEFTESLISNIKSTVNKKSKKESVPNSLGFERLVSSRLNRIENNLALIKELNEIKTNESQRFGILPEKGPIYLNTEIKVLSPNEKFVEGSPFNRLTIKNNREIMRKILDFDIFKFKYIRYYFNEEEKLTDTYNLVNEIVVKDSRFTIDGNNSYKPSSGEKSILSISGILENSNYDYYLFDEIERGLGNKYISEYLIPRLNELRELGKTIIISTHNANVAINTLPSQWIYCAYSTDSDNIYYQGNMYSNQLNGLVDNERLVWSEKAIEHLEGSEEMFKTRGNLYGIK